jgi:t-SNARE complex subunit (syntaxin)
MLREEKIEPFKVTLEQTKKEITSLLKTYNEYIVDKLKEKGLDIVEESVIDDENYIEEGFSKTEIAVPFSADYFNGQATNETVNSLMTVIFNSDVEAIRNDREQAEATRITFDPRHLHMVEGEDGGIEYFARYYKVS